MNSTVEIVGQHPQPDADAAPVLQDHPTQSVTAIDGWRSALFGFPFLAAGDRLTAYAGGEIPLEFRLPANQLTTSLISAPPVYREIEARGQSGKDTFQAYFLVPVYKAV
jgi:hypothetical protein